MASRARTGAGSLLGWPGGAGGSQASKPQCPKGCGCLRPTQGPDLGAGWPPPWQGLASGGRRRLGTGWSVNQSGCCPGSPGYRDPVARPPGQGVRAGAQSAEVPARLQIGNRSRQSGQQSGQGAPGTWGLDPVPSPEPREGTPWLPAPTGWLEGAQPPGTPHHAHSSSVQVGGQGSAHTGVEEAGGNPAIGESLGARGAGRQVQDPGPGR